jgi:RNA polymerase sigma-70 factor (ECF subfamily)
VHDAFARVCRSPGVLLAAGDPVAYVFAAVRNAAVDQVRRPRIAGHADRSPGGTRPPVPVSIFNGHVERPDALALGAERERSVAAAVEALAADQKEVVLLRVYAGLTFAQIAQVIDAPLPTVATRYRRALERHKRRLEKLV